MMRIPGTRIWSTLPWTGTDVIDKFFREVLIPANDSSIQKQNFGRLMAKTKNKRANTRQVYLWTKMSIIAKQLTKISERYRMPVLWCQRLQPLSPASSPTRTLPFVLFKAKERTSRHTDKDIWRNQDTPSMVRGWLRRLGITVKFWHVVSAFLARVQALEECAWSSKRVRRGWEATGRYPVTGGQKLA